MVSRQEHSRSSGPALSVVVFAYRNEATIERVVGAALAQESDEPYEVVVASSGGDRTGEIVRRTFPQVRVREWPTRLLPGGVRNLGRRMANGEIVAFLEADMLPRPGWVSGRLRAHRAGHEAVAGGIAVTANESRASRATAYLVFDNRLVFDDRPSGLVSGPANLPHSYALSFTKDLLDRAGPFDETVRIEEDTFMAERVFELGVTPWFESSVCCEHIGPSTLGELLAEQRARGRRSARGEILRWPTVSATRVAWESRERSAVPTAALRSIRQAVYRGRWIAKNLNRASADHRDLLSTGPWIAAGFVANQLGWAEDQIAYARARPLAEPSDAVEVSSPFRTRVASTGERVLALAFDRSPGPYTDGLLSVLADYDVHATFFLSGEEAASSPEAVRSIAGSGHVVASGGWTGRSLTEIDRSSVDLEIVRASSSIAELTGNRCVHFRPPGGSFNAQLVTQAARHGLTLWRSTHDPRDLSASPDARRVAKEVLASVTPGAVLVLHDDRVHGGHVVGALPEIIEGMLARRLGMVTLDYATAARGTTADREHGPVPISPLACHDLGPER